MIRTFIFITAILAGCLTTDFVLAQPDYEWAGKFGGTADEYGNDVITDAAGNIYTCGYFEGTVDFDPGAGVLNLVTTGANDIFITKQDAAGNLVWARQMGGTDEDYGYSLTLDASGNVITTGSFSGTGDFDPGAGTFNLIGSGLGDTFISKLDNNGNFVWARHFVSNTSSVNYSEDVHIDASGNIFISGMFLGTADFDPGAGTTSLTAAGATYDIFVSKLDASGNLLWVKQLGTSTADYTHAATIDATGNFYLTASYQGTIDTDPGAGTANVTSVGMRDIFILKLDPSGNFVWSKNIGGTAFDYIYDACVDADGNFYATGLFQSTVDFDPGAGTVNLSSAGGYDGFVLKLDAGGLYLWAGRMGGTGSEYMGAMAVDQSGDAYITGFYQGTADFDPGAGTATLTAMGSDDAFITRLNSSGNFVWTMPIPGTVEESGMGIAIDYASNIIVTGYFSSPVDFDPGAGVATVTSTGMNYDTFIAKYSQCSSDILDPVPDLLTLPDINAACMITSLTAPTATDNCTGTISGTHNATLPITIQGTTVVTWTYDDGNGNSVTQDQNVIIDDNMNPAADAVTLADVTAQCSVTSLTAPTATDNCTGTISGTHNATLPITTPGTTIVTWTYDDGNGNVTTQNQNVIIDDNTGPVADIGTLADVTGQCSVTSLTVPTATDNCAGMINGTHNATLPITIPGTTIVTWTYDDGNGNVITQNQNVIIDDTTNPVADAVALADITSECSVTSLTTPTATDNCAGTVSGAHNATLPITAAGTTVVTWTYDDGNGNVITQNQDVIINLIDNTVTVTGITLTASASGYSYQWIDCGNGNAPVAGETGQSYTATANGTYAVEIDNGTCAVTSACQAIDGVGLQEAGLDVVTIYPNPFADVLIITSAQQVIRVEVINVQGQLMACEIHPSNSIQLETAAWPAGSYVIRVYTDAGAVNKLLIK